MATPCGQDHRTGHRRFRCYGAHAFHRGTGVEICELSYEDLDMVAKGDSLKMLSTRQPAVHEFSTSNIELPGMQKLIAPMMKCAQPSAG